MKRYIAFFILDKQFWHLPLTRVLFSGIVARDLDEAKAFAGFFLGNAFLWNYKTYAVARRPS